MELYTLHLFAGAGGGILADEIMGFRTIGAVELEEYPRRVLLARQADGCLPQFPVWDDVTTFRADNPGTRNYIERLRTVRDRLCISGGFPCQDISAAGKGVGITGTRSGLWKEYARIIGEIRPRFAFLENSPFLIRRGFEDVTTDLELLGYNFTWGIFSARDVGAPHLRERFWGLAISNGDVFGTRGKLGDKEMEGDIPNADGSQCKTSCDRRDNGVEQFGFDELCRGLSDSLHSRRFWRLWKRQKDSGNGELDAGRKAINASGTRREAQPRLGRVADGLEDWLDEVATGRFWDVTEHGLPRLLEQCENRRKRLKAIGNGQVPLCAAVAFVTLLDRYIQFTQ